MTLQCDLAEPCDPRVRCTNLNPGFRCDPCPPGFTGSPGVEGIGLEEAYYKRQQCYDIDECNDGRNGGCARNSVCNNVEVCCAQLVTVLLPASIHTGRWLMHTDKLVRSPKSLALRPKLNMTLPANMFLQKDSTGCMYLYFNQLGSALTFQASVLICKGIESISEVWAPMRQILLPPVIG